MLSAVRASPPSVRHQRDELAAELDLEVGCAAPHDLGELVLGERLELVHLRAGEERGVDLVVRVLGRRADQRHEARLDAGQQRVLLRLVEAVDLVEEEDRAPAGACRAAPAPARAPRARP